MVRYTTNFSAKVSEIIPYARNARQHNAAQIAQIAASIREFGFTNPVLVDESLTLIAGHGRLSAAQLLGLDTIPAIRIDGLTDTQKQALRLADNKLALNAGWDDDLVRTELAELRDIGFDLALTGFGDDELAALFALDDIELQQLPPLPNGDRNPFQQMTFTLHDDQVETVKAALDVAKERGGFGGPNENSNGNALARICEAYA
jgi:hypothetical protein